VTDLFYAAACQTDFPCPDVTRHFLLPCEAVGLTLQALVASKGRDILVPELGSPVRLLGDRNLAVGVRFTGPLPGEKLHEDLIAADAKKAQL
jgi:FlaA1/EpsC-like NDP-sugar epimerase